MNKLLWWVFAGTTGGPNRARIVKALNKRPYNAHQLAGELELNYKTIRHHLKILTENHIITSMGKNSQIKSYFLSNKMEEKYHIFKDIWKEL
jgi:DNA-binding transcriptional ArsR family regulator